MRTFLFLLILAVNTVLGTQISYVTNNDDDTVSVIEVSTGTVTNTITVGSLPFGVAFTPDGKTAYVVNTGDNNVSVIDASHWDSYKYYYSRLPTSWSGIYP